MVVTNSASVRRVARKRLSPSTAKAMEGCPARFAAEKLLPGREDPFGPAPLGTDAHAVMEELLKLPGADRTVERADELLLSRLITRSAPDPREGWPGIPPERGPEWVSAVRENYTGLFAIEDPTAVDVYGTEIRLDSVEIEGVPFVGFIDRADNTVTRRGEPRIHLVDYKTGKPSWAPRGKANPHEDQIRLYIVAMSILLDMPVSHLNGSIFYTKQKFSKARRVAASRTKITDTVQRFSNAWSDLNSYVEQESFPCVASPLCGWCPLVSVCPVAKAEGKVARMEGLPTADQFDLPVLRQLDTESYLLTAAEVAAAKADAVVTEDLPPDLAHLDALADEYGDRTAPPAEALGDDPADAPAGGCNDPAAHVSDETPVNEAGTPEDPQTGSRKMAKVLREDKSWEETAGPDATLNPNSYAAMAAFGTVGLAVETLHKNGVPLKGSVVKEFSQALAAIVADVQKEFTGRTSMQEGMNTRLRGALRSALETLPCPFGSSADDLASWAEQLTRRTRSIATVAVALWDVGEPQLPDFTALSAVEPSAWAKSA